MKIPDDDRRRLKLAMFNYRIDAGVGYEVKTYGGGLMMVRDSSHGSGRCLFFSVGVEKGEEILTALLVYKKESQEAPARILETARTRMRGAK